MAFDSLERMGPISYDEALIPFGQLMGKLSNAVDIDCRYYIRLYIHRCAACRTPFFDYRFCIGYIGPLVHIPYLIPPFSIFAENVTNLDCHPSQNIVAAAHIDGVVSVHRFRVEERSRDGGEDDEEEGEEGETPTGEKGTHGEEVFSYLDYEEACRLVKFNLGEIG